VLAIAGDTGHTRLPVFHEDLDHVVGIVHVKDLLTGETADRPVADLLRPVPAVPESRDLESLLKQMLEDRAHVALVVDEYGGTAGVVTLEDILEELVGDIEDEFDDDHGARRAADRVWVVPGTFRRDELARLTGLELEDGETETVSGWLTDRIGRLLVAGDRQRPPHGWSLTVLTLDGRRAGEVEVRAPDPTPTPTGDAP
jgi:putative hemolysin